ncbi:hypothetical protein CI109_106714 [Kwoniella shandongensis]|uniref:Zn(2)-C6 fungal-type domain-containing protein n=1 Tax=Kwoniella shandongensis TaxID=1734106 RepID=A0AAJ8N075_9TREE
MSRIKQSCTECRRRKIKCNRQIPCDMCVSRGEEDQCEEQVITRISGDRSFPRMKDFRILAARVAELEAHVTILRDGGERPLNGTRQRSHSQLIPVAYGDDMDISYDNEGSASPSRGPLPSTSPPNRPFPTDQHWSTTALPTDRSHEGADSAALLLEDFAMGHVVNQERAGKRQGPTISNQLYQAIGKAISILPDSDRSLFLLNFFVLHVPSYMEEFRRFAALPKDRMTMEVRSEWLSVHLVVLCLSLHLLGDNERQVLGVRGDQWQDIAKGLFLASRDILFASDFLTHHSLEHLQCIVLQGDNADGAADAHWALIGSAVKIAQNLGLHRLGNEDVGLETSWPKPWQDPLKREIGRRVWWNIVYLDWSHALSHGMTYCVHSKQNFTAFPSNVDDTDITHQSVPTPKPLAEYTTSSYTIYRLRFLVLYKEHIDHLVDKQPADYAFILRLDARLVALCDSLPSHFREDEEARRLASVLKLPHIIAESIAIRMIAANRLLRLHRPYLIGGYTDPKYRRSSHQCVSSARTILALYETLRVTAPSMMSYWLVLFYEFAAAVVIFIHICNCEPGEREESHLILLRALDVLKGARGVSAAARNATSILESLLTAWSSLTAEEGVRPMNGQSRVDDEIKEETLFRKIVRRVLGSTALPEIPLHSTTRDQSATPAQSQNTVLPPTPRTSIPVESLPVIQPETLALDGMWQGAVHGHATVQQQQDFDLGTWSDLGIASNNDFDIYGVTTSTQGHEQELEHFLASITS